MKARHRQKSVVEKYFRRTFKNKLCAIALFIIGWLSIGICDDATFFVYLSIFALPMFFTDKEWII